MSVSDVITRHTSDRVDVVALYSYQLTLQTSSNTAAKSQTVHAYGIGQAYDSDVIVISDL